MTVAYITDQDARLRVTGERIIISGKSDDNPQETYEKELQLTDLESLHLFGRVEITTPAIQKLLFAGIEVAFYTIHGKIIGQLTPPRPQNIMLRLRQYDLCRDEAFALPLAREIVVSKIESTISIIKQSDYNRDEIELAPVLENLRRKIADAGSAISISQLLGIEGTAASAYWHAFRHLICQEGITFSGREKRPPPDPVNALLSLGYVMLGGRIQSLLDGIGLDPYLGFFHQPQDRRPSLALDLIEPFRPDFVDRLTLRIFNLGTLKPDHFTYDPSDGARLSRDGLKKYLAAFEKMLGTQASRKGRSLTWHEWLRHSVEDFAGRIRTA